MSRHFPHKRSNLHKRFYPSSKIMEMSLCKSPQHVLTAIRFRAVSPFWLLTRPIWGSGLQTFQAPSTLSKPLVPGSEAVYCKMVKSFAAKYEYLNLSWQFWLTHHNSRVWPSPHWIISRYTPLSVQHVPPCSVTSFPLFFFDPAFVK